MKIINIWVTASWHTFCICVCKLHIGECGTHDMCFTPSGKPGNCIPQNTCTPYVDATLRFANQLTTGDLMAIDEVSKFIKESKCGVNEKVGINVCCETTSAESITASSTTTTTQQPTTSTQTTTNSEDEIDPVVENDSYPEPRKTCGKDTSGDRIIGGTVTDLDEFPWMAILQYRKPSDPPGFLKSACGGSLLNNRYIMTAAHCLVEKVTRTVGVLTNIRLGEYNTNTEHDCIDNDCADPPQDISIHSFYPHPGFSEMNRNKKDDIGLVRLSRRVKYNNFVSALCLVNPTSRYSAGSITFVSGWGVTSLVTVKLSPVKLKVDVPIFDTEKCFELYSRSNLTQNQICAGGEPNKDSCKGDSGGPLMRLTPEDKWEAIGVVAHGISCGEKGVPGVYTSVSSYVNWIQNTMMETNV